MVIVPPERETPGISAMRLGQPVGDAVADGEVGQSPASSRPTRSAQ